MKGARKREGEGSGCSPQTTGGGKRGWGGSACRHGSFKAGRGFWGGSLAVPAGAGWGDIGSPVGFSFRATEARRGKKGTSVSPPARRGAVGVCLPAGGERAPPRSSQKSPSALKAPARPPAARGR